MKKAPPLLVSFENIESYLHAFKGTENESESCRKKLYKKNLPPVVSKICLSVLFGYSTSFVTFLLKKPEKFYRIFQIPRGKNQKREIQTPKVALKIIQRWFAEHLSNVYLSEESDLSYSDSACGFIKGRTTMSGAIKHCNSKWVYCLDIKDFFESVSKDMVISNLKKIGYNKDSSNTLATLCCYKERLPQGAPSSPILSNLAFQKTDNEILKYAKRCGIIYTRYADDLAFSSKEEFSNDKLESFKKKLKQIIQNNNWTLNDKKERYAVHPQRLKIYGLLVHGKYPRLTKGYRNKIRTYKYLVEKNKIIKKEKQIKGHLAYASAVDKFANKIKKIDIL